MRSAVILTLATLMAGTAAVTPGLGDVPVFRTIAPETEPGETLAGQIAFSDVRGALLRSVATSEIGLVGGTVGVQRTATPLAGAELQVCSDATCEGVVRGFSSGPARVLPGQGVRLRLAVGDVVGTMHRSGLMIGTERHEWNVGVRPSPASIGEFPMEMSAVRNAEVVSRPAALSGYAAADASSGVDLRICADEECELPLTSWGTSLEGADGQFLQMRLHAAAGLGEPRQAIVRWGEAEQSWTVVSEGPSSPTGFWVSGPYYVHWNIAVETSPVYVLGMRGTHEVTASPPPGIVLRASVAGAPYADLPVDLSDDQSLVLEATSSRAQDGGITAVPITIGSTSSNWTIRMADTTPDAFDIPATTGQVEGQTATSAIIWPRGFDTPTTIFADGGLVSIDNGPFVGSSPIRPYQNVRVRADAPDFGQSRTIPVTIGETSSTWTITSRQRITSPRNFAISPPNNAEPGVLVTSQATAVHGFDGPIEISMVGGQVSVNEGPFLDRTTINAGDTFRARAMSAEGWAANASYEVRVGGFTTEYRISTRRQRTNPTRHDIANVTDAEPNAVVTSEVITLTDYDGPLTINGGGAMVSVEGGPFALTGVVYPGQSFVLQTVAAPHPEQQRLYLYPFGNHQTGWIVRTRDYRSCSSPWGDIAHGEGVSRYESAYTYGSECRYQYRSCNDGVLSGSYTALSCTVRP